MSGPNLHDSHQKDLGSPVTEKPLHRMISYVGMKMETLEIRYADLNEEKELVWRTEFAKAEHAILDEISKTLTLVQAYEGDFKQILQRKMGPRRK